MHPASSWTVVLPLRGGDRSKTRLAASLNPLRGKASADDARRLAGAMSADVAAAALASSRVHRVVLLTSSAGPAPLPDGPIRQQVEVAYQWADPRDPLNSSLRDWLAGDDGSDQVAFLVPDLPCLTTAVLDDALARAERWDAAFVPDHDGTGTVLLAGRRAALRPCFGRDSARRHATHARPLVWEAPALRRDVDTATDLAHARRLGVGPHTAEVLVELGLLVELGFSEVDPVTADEG